MNIDNLDTDLKYAVRGLAANRALALSIIATLALAISAASIAFSVVNAVLIRDLPYKDGGRVVWVWSMDTRRSLQQWTSYPDFLDWRARSTSFDHFAGWGSFEAVLTGTGNPERLPAALTSGDLFGLLGVPAFLGAADEAHLPPGGPVAVMSYGLWQRHFNSDPTIVGRSITLNGQPVVVAAVMPAGFEFPIGGDPIQVWQILREGQFNPALRNRRDARLIEVIARLKPGVTVAQANAEMTTIALDLANENPASNADVGVHVVSGKEQVAGSVSQALILLFAAVGCLMLLACVNVANALLVRTTRRRPEIALRTTLGASTSRVVRQLLVENVLLWTLGGGLGLALTFAGVASVSSWLPADLPRAGDIRVDGGVLLFSIAATIVTALTFGLAPAFTGLRVNLAEVLQEQDRTATSTRAARRIASGLAGFEIAIALLLMTGAGLFIGSFLRLNQAAPAFDPRNVLSFEVNWPTGRYTRVAAGRAFDELKARLQEIPGVRGASVGLQLPDRGRPLLDDVLPFVEPEDRVIEPGEQLRTTVLMTQPGYFGVLGIPLLRGRDFTSADVSAPQQVVIVNAALANAYFPGIDPTGKRLKMSSWAYFGDRTPMIVGVAADVTHQGLEAAAPLVYVPLAQFPLNSAHMVVKTNGDPLALVGQVRAALASVDPNQPLYDIQTLEQRLRRSINEDRFRARLLGLFGLAALLVAATGLCGVLTHTVAQRKREIGIRMALGATQEDVLMLVVRQGMTVAVAGAAAGLAASLALTRVMASLLFGISPFNPFVLIGATLVLVLVAFIASLVPARRATSVSPITAIR